MFNALTDPYLEHIYEIYDQVIAEFEKLSADDQTKNMASISDEGMKQMLDYVYDHYDNFKLLLKCGDSGKYEDFIHGMVAREIKSSHRYLEKMKEEGVEVPVVDDSLMHMIYTGFFSSIFQIIEHDIDRITAKENIKQLKQFNIGGWERLWNVKF